MDIQPITTTAAIAALLENEQLPADDVSPGPLMPFFGATDSDELVGVIGCELHGEVALLRSLVVVEKFRSAGLASQLIDTVEQTARDSGARSIYLLTLHADGYFLRHGYTLIERDLAPAVIQRTAQFSSLCPGSAKVLMKTL